MYVNIVNDYDEMSLQAAICFVSELKKKPNSVVCFSTGSTPIGMYDLLIKKHQSGEIDMSQIVSFNLDEYLGLKYEHDQSYYYYMNNTIFKFIELPRNNIYVPNMSFHNKNDINEFCLWYEDELEKRGGIDLLILSIGSNGHLAFNEPGAPLNSVTRKVKLSKKTINDNARFFAKVEEVPQWAITMGIKTILSAKKIIFIVSGLNKAQAIKDTLEGPITNTVPTSFLQFHNNITAFIDKEASSFLKYQHHDEIIEKI